MTVPATVTSGDIIDLALRDAGIIGVGQSALAEDTNRAFTRLNWMVDQWARQRWFCYHLITLNYTSTGAQTYDIGPGATAFPMDVRPDRIEAAFLRQLNTGNLQVDYPLQLIQARETYNNIALKTLQSFPTYLFYDSDWPTGTLYPWPIPQASIYALFVSVKMVLSEFANLADPIILPPEYFKALHTNLAVILRDAYDLPPKQVAIAQAKVSLNTLRKANSQIPRLQMPDGLTSPGRYNVFSDQVR